jgi:hypothetical protein
VTGADEYHDDRVVGVTTRDRLHITRQFRRMTLRANCSKYPRVKARDRLRLCAQIVNSHYETNGRNSATARTLVYSLRACVLEATALDDRYACSL